MIDRAAVVVFVKRIPLEAEPRLLSVTNRAFGGIALPGGKAKEGEAIRTAARREVEEETSLIAFETDLTLLAKGNNALPNSVCEVHMFFARYAWGEPKDIEPGTVHEWVTMAEMLERSPFRAFYEQYLPDGIRHLRPTFWSTPTPISTR